MDAALRVLGVLQGGSSTAGTELTDALQALTMLLRSWEVLGLTGWARKQGSFSLTSGTASYTLGTSGTGLTERPAKIVQAWLRDSSSQDTALYPLTRREYLNIINKADAGPPASFYYDPQTPTGTIYLYPVMNDSTHSLVLDYQRPMSELDSGTDSLELPPEWHRALKWNLADELALEWGLKDIPPGLKEKAAQTLALAVGGTKPSIQQPITGWPDEAYYA